jgi:hypothetical protein
VAVDLLDDKAISAKQREFMQRHETHKKTCAAVLRAFLACCDLALCVCVCVCLCQHEHA